MWRQIAENGLWEGEILDRRKSGEVFPALLSIFKSEDRSPEPVFHVGILNDQTDLKQTMKQFEYMSFTDSLTGLGNRLIFKERLKQIIQLDHRGEQKRAVLFIALDRFKQINDSLGHAAGDFLLSTFADRLKAQLRESDTVARWGGDEFVACITDITTPQDILKVADKIIRAACKPVEYNNHQMKVSASVGSATFPDDGEEPEILIHNADVAMHEAKKMGRNQHSFFSARLNNQAAQRYEMEEDLHHALKQEEFVLYYQPKIDTFRGHVVGLEALIRWQHPEKGMISPGEFIPLAEETGFIDQMGEWILRTACRQARKLADTGLGHIRVAVNLAARQFLDPNLVVNISRILDETGCLPQSLEVEVTESSMMGDIESACRVVAAIRKLGIKIALDDFGTGYSSLSYIQRFAPDSVKIDQSFIRNIQLLSGEEAIVEAAITMASKLGFTTIAEGVENAEQWQLLKELGCDEIQGYYTGRPVPALELDLLTPRQLHGLA